MPVSSHFLVCKHICQKEYEWEISLLIDNCPWSIDNNFHFYSCAYANHKNTKLVTFLHLTLDVRMTACRLHGNKRTAYGIRSYIVHMRTGLYNFTIACKIPQNRFLNVKERSCNYLWKSECQNCYFWLYFTFLLFTKKFTFSLWAMVS